MPVRLFPLVAALLLLTLAACTPGPPGGAVSQTAAASRPSAATLPGVDVPPGEALVLNYPPASLYPPGAVLPDATGLARLEALAKWLADPANGRWQASLNVDPATAGELAPALARKRQQLLQQFMVRQGVGEETLNWQAQAAAGPELELKPLN